MHALQGSIALLQAFVVSLNLINRITAFIFARDAKLLVELRQSLSATSDYLLRTVGVRAHDQLTREVSQYYSRQVDLLARLLLSQSKSLDQN